jgi:hypothetical protein
MPQLAINTIIDVTDAEADALADAFGCTPLQLQGHLQLYAPAALREYVDMFAGQVIASASDARERRLLAILLALPEFPSDETIARLFNLTANSARSLLRTTISRHRNKLKAVMEAAAKRFLLACQQAQAGGDWEARCPNVYVIEMLNAQLAVAVQPRTPIRRKAGTFDAYVVANGAKNELAIRYP